MKKMSSKRSMLDVRWRSVGPVMGHLLVIDGCTWVWLQTKAAVQSQKAVTAHFSSEQLLAFGFVVTAF